MSCRGIRTAVASAALLLGGVLFPAEAEVRLPAIFGDHMVLQRDAPLTVWGWADPGELVRVSLKADHVKTRADGEGAWRVTLPEQRAGGPFDLHIWAGDGSLVVGDVLIGEVWIASGQSNMEWPVRAANDAEAEIAAADHPRIRLFSVKHAISFEPLDDVEGSWQVCSPATVAPFSAVAYYFGRRLHTELDVPIGLINSSWGGTIIEAWTDRESMATVFDGGPRLARLDIASAREDSVTVAARRRAEADITSLINIDVAARRMASFDLDDRDWPRMEIPNQWEQAGLADFDGLVWFRRSMDLPASWAGRELTLHLGPVDEIDITWFNGTRVGGMGDFASRDVQHWNEARHYPVPAAAVRGGRNVIAVLAIDTAGAGGLWGADPAQMYLEVTAGGDPLSVAGAWRYQPGPRLVPVPTATPNRPTVLYNAMIHPLVTFGLRGAIWYQGESNVGEGGRYLDRMKALIGGWRGLWGMGEFPFYYVQIAPYKYGADPHFLPEIWEAQSDALGIGNTGMAVITDVGNVDNIHPTNKQDVGRRLALWALAQTYGRNVGGHSGPLFKRAQAVDGALRLYFKHADGLQSSDGGPLTWFEVAGDDNAFHAAKARIDGASILVSSPEVGSPKAARFAWHETAEPNLVNGQRLPASPFRTRR